MRDPNPVIYLVPGVGLIAFAKDKSTARIAAEFYVNAINVMRGASGVDRYVGLSEQEAFDIEYWLLEEAKLLRMPKPRAMQGRVALVTGGAGGIGSAIARRMLAEGACVIIADIDAANRDAVVEELAAAFGADAVRGVAIDVTREESVEFRLRRRRARLWRARHRRVQRRHRLGRGGRGHQPRVVESQHGDPRRRILPHRARRLPPDEGSKSRRVDHLYRVKERTRGLARRLGLLRGQGARTASRPLSRA